MKTTTTTIRVWSGSSVMVFSELTMGAEYLSAAREYVAAKGATLIERETWAGEHKMLSCQKVESI